MRSRPPPPAAMPMMASIERTGVVVTGGVVESDCSEREREREREREIITVCMECVQTMGPIKTSQLLFRSSLIHCIHEVRFMGADYF